MICLLDWKFPHSRFAQFWNPKAGPVNTHTHITHIFYNNEWHVCTLGYISGIQRANTYTHKHATKDAETESIDSLFLEWEYNARCAMPAHSNINELPKQKSRTMCTMKARPSCPPWRLNESWGFTHRLKCRKIVDAPMKIQASRARPDTCLWQKWNPSNKWRPGARKHSLFYVFHNNSLDDIPSCVVKPFSLPLSADGLRSSNVLQGSRPLFTREIVRLPAESRCTK